MGTTYSVKAVTETASAEPAALQTAIQHRLEEIESRMSHYRPDSELSRFNRFAATTPYPMSRETLNVVQQALAVNRVSGGAFDITVGSLVDAWGFGPSGRATSPPDAVTLDRLLVRVGFDQLVVDVEASTLRKRHPAVTADLSAIAKGFAVDAVSATLVDFGVTSYLVEIGGELRAAGSNEDGLPWRIAIERPQPGPPIVQRIVPLMDGALATSGEYRNFYDLEGARVSHTIDPRTGRPVVHRLQSVSVVADRCALADALATALEVLGPDDGYALAVEQGWAALFVVRNEDGALAERATPAFDRLVGLDLSRLESHGLLSPQPGA